MDNNQNYNYIAANCYLHVLLPLLAASAMGSELTEGMASPEMLTSLKVALTHTGTTGAVEVAEGAGKMRRYFDAENVLHVVLGNKQSGEGMEAGIYRLAVRAEYGTGETAEVTLDFIVPDVVGDEVEELAPMPLRVNDTMLPAGGGGGMEQYILSLSGGKITHEGEPLTFAEVKAAVEDKSKFVYLNYANALHLPCFIVDSEGNSAVAFSAAFQVSGAPFIERVAINEAEEVKVDNMRCVHFGESNGVAIGIGTTASGDYSHAEGDGTTASEYCSHAEGNGTTASGEYSHAEGDGTTASGEYSHAEGIGTTASGEYSHAEGYYTIASEYCSRAEGDGTTASSDYSHAEGCGTVTTEIYQHAQGMYNNAEFGDGGEFMHGCGTSNTDRKNAFSIGSDGKVYVIGLGGYDGTNHTEALSLQELLGLNNIQASNNKAVNGYQVPNLTAEQVTAAYNAVVSGRPITITDATGKYHLSVMQADTLDDGAITISIIYLNVMLVSYTISGSTVDIQYKTL